MRSSTSALVESQPHGRSATSKIFTFASVGVLGRSGSTSTIFFQADHVWRSEPPVATVPRGGRMEVAIFLWEGQLLPELIAFLFPDNLRVMHAHTLPRIYYREDIDTQIRLETVCASVSHVWGDHETQMHMSHVHPCLIRVRSSVRSNGDCSAVAEYAHGVSNWF